ncbi:MAG: diguanylate cyclase [Bacillota bacterium]
MLKLRSGKFSLGSRFIVGTGIMLLPLVIMAFSSFFSFQESIVSFNKIAEETSAELAPIVDLHKNLLKSMLPAHDYLANGSPEERIEFNSLSQRVDAAFVQTLKAPFAEAEEMDLVLSAREEWEQARSITEAVLALPLPVGNHEAALELDRGDAYIARASAALDQAYDLGDQEMKAELAETYSEKERLLYTIGLIFVLGLAVALAAGILLARSILIPLHQLEEGARNIGEGNLAYRVELNNQDELGRLAEAFNTMADKLESSQAELKELTVRDSLTGLYNHREFQNRLKEEFARSRRYARPLSLLMIDIDHFKKINDTYGHQVGDEVLCAFSRRLVREVRPIDEISRYGGEEFVIILPETSAQGALATAERIRSLIARQSIIDHNGQSVPMTISIGVSVYPEDGLSENELIRNADHALYAAKQSGRNCVRRFDRRKTRE